jgi:hypothetical protein
MSVITKGKTFANGEQLTAAKLNQMLDAATFSSAAVDNTKTTLSGGAITVAPGGVSFTELATALVNDTDTMTDASATTLATSESIKAYIDAQIDASRPKYVEATGGSHALTLQNQSGTVTYTISDFQASGQSGFSTSQIIAIVGGAMSISQGATNEIFAVLPSSQSMRIARSMSLPAVTGSQVETAPMFYIPINSDTSSISFSFTNGNTGASIYNEIAIKGFVIQETL